MAQMNRNVNVEEIEADALFGIDALRYQTVFQKIVFYGSILLGVALNIALPLVFQTRRIVCALIFIALLLAGVALGCNYTEDLSYGRYLYEMLFHPTKNYYYRSSEEIGEIRKKSEELKRHEEMILQKAGKADPKEGRKMLLLIIGFLLTLALILGGIFIYRNNHGTGITHHEITQTERK